MKSFSESNFQAVHRPLEDASVSVTLKHTGHELFLRLDAKDTIQTASYTGTLDLWLGSLCQLITGLPLGQALRLEMKDWDQQFGTDQFYWDMRQEHEQDIFLPALEMLKTAADIYHGREDLYLPASPLVCRCFGVRESDILQELKAEPELTLAALSAKTKAGMGCRSCVPQLRRWLEGKASREHAGHFYKDKSRADWVLEIHQALKDFPDAAGWGMEVQSFKGGQVIISYHQEVAQNQLEEVSRKLQRYLASVVDRDLGFFLSRSRQR
jgi:bacterioferritin-associated ferredoxin